MKIDPENMRRLAASKGRKEVRNCVGNSRRVHGNPWHRTNTLAGKAGVLPVRGHDLGRVDCQMRDSAAPETLGAERDELVSNVLQPEGGARFTTGAIKGGGSGPGKVRLSRQAVASASYSLLCRTKVARASLDAWSRPTGTSRR